MNQTDVEMQNISNMENIPTMENTSSIWSYLDLWSDGWLVEMTALIVLATLLTAYLLYRTLIYQNLTNSAKVSRELYRDMIKDHDELTRIIGDNKKIREECNNKKHNTDCDKCIEKEYVEDKLIDYLNDLEIVSAYIKDRIIKIDYGFNIYFAIYHQCINDPKIYDYIHKDDRYYNDIIKISKWYTRYRVHKYRFLICYKCHLGWWL